MLYVGVGQTRVPRQERGWEVLIDMGHLRADMGHGTS